ncbi:MAG: HslU--HslV peptidase ATPase subunit, partial [Alphaproteobacteria bacterium]
EEAIDRLAELSFNINESVENIGARRLATVMERLLEDISFTAPDKGEDSILIDRALVDERVGILSDQTDLSRFIL